jgi:hypothetical protein
MFDSKLAQPLPQKKLTQDLVAGNPKAVIRQKIGVERRLVLRHLQRAAAALTPNIPGMSWAQLSRTCKALFLTSETMSYQIH